MREEGAILGAMGFDAGFRWERGPVAGDTGEFQSKSSFWAGMLIWPDERVGDLGGTGMK
jgi:hypothetical protein